MICRGFMVGWAAMALVLGGCGGGQDAAGNSGSAETADEPPTGNATAAEVADEQRGDVDCPAKAKTARAAGSPVDDVVGVRPGMNWDEAANVVLCDNEMLVMAETKSRNYRIETYGAAVRQGFEARFAEPRVEKTGAQIVQEMQDEMTRRGNNAYEAPLQPGQVRYFVSTMGMPGVERVMSVAREEYFPAGKLPAIAGVDQALIAKYGPPTKVNDYPAFKHLYWNFDPMGRPITETSPLYHQCNGSASPDGSTSLSPDCGISIAADIKRAEGNPGLAHSLAVSSKNGAAGYALLTATEQALLQANKTRQASEIQEAQQDAAQPKL